MCFAPKPPKVPKPARVTPLRAPEETAQRATAPEAVKGKRRNALLGLSQLRSNLQAPSGLNVPK